MRDTAGDPFPDARVRIRNLTSGVAWWVNTEAGGRFKLSLLPPGEYEVFVEQIGYQPNSIGPVPVLPGRVQRVSLVLRPVELPVQMVQEVRYDRPVEESRADRGLWFEQFELFDLPEGHRELTELARLSSRSNPELGSEGLPATLSGLYVDGLPFAATRHPDLPPGQLIGSAFPLSGFQSAELLTNAVDVEWSGFAGAYLSGYTRQGTVQPEGVGYADWVSGEAVTSEHFEPSDVTANAFRAGGALTGPIVPDTAHYVIGIEGQRLRSPLSSAWETETLNAQLIQVADSFGAHVRPYTRTRLTSADIVSGFGKFDWQITGNHQVSIRGNGSWYKRGGGNDRDPGLDPSRIASLGAEIEGSAFSAGATLSSRFGSIVGSELRVGLDRTDREFRSTTPPGTRIVDAGLAFGSDPAFPGKFEGLVAGGSETLHFDVGRHLLKLGVGLAFKSADETYAFANGGLFTFAGIDELRTRQGAFMIADGPSQADFNNRLLSLYVQDTWTAAPGLELTGGLRYEHESLDDEAVRLNREWEDLTGLSNASFDNKIDKVSPRFGFSWNIGERDEWFVRGSAGLYHDVVDPGLFGELAILDGDVIVRRGVGDLGAWPDLPGAGVAPGQGARLTLLGPDFRPPRSTRASLGITRLFPDGTRLMLSGTYRFTDQLPRRADLNLPLAPAAVDQYGRSVFGTLLQQGSALTVDPGTNRRFDGFDLVSAVNADGESRYWDATITVQRHASEMLDVLASYTYSWARDDWLGGSGGGAGRQLDPFPNGLDGTDWRDGRSDFDRPHRLVVGAEAKFPQAMAGARIAALYRLTSGRPFTPGFRAGVDVNGDGSDSNDPAFVDPEIAGMDALLGQWGCIADQVGQFAERNSCRGPDLHELDVRVALGLVEVQGHPVEIVADGLNLLDADMGTRDSALLLVDREAALQVNPDGSLTLPLVANRSFGEALVRDASGRSFRLGLRVGL